MNAVCGDEAAFLDAMRAEPDDLTTALVYADWLEERGRGERAEFVRVQCELAIQRAGHYQASPENDRAQDTLQAREQALLTAHEAEWRKAGPCLECEGAEIDGSKVMCPYCYSTGDAGGLLREFQYESSNDPPEVSNAAIGSDGNSVTFSLSRPVGVAPVGLTWRRGVIDTVTVPLLTDVMGRTYEHEPNGNVGGRWWPLEWARAVVRAHRSVRGFVPLDRVPFHHPARNAQPEEWAWGTRHHDFTPRHMLPKVITDLMLEARLPKDGRSTYPTREAAIDALAVALGEIAREGV